MRRRIPLRASALESHNLNPANSLTTTLKSNQTPNVIDKAIKMAV